jgi:hypothetical protein
MIPAAACCQSRFWQTRISSKAFNRRILSTTINPTAAELPALSQTDLSLCQQPSRISFNPQKAIPSLEIMLQ